MKRKNILLTVVLMSLVSMTTLISCDRWNGKVFSNSRHYDDDDYDDDYDDNYDDSGSREPYKGHRVPRIRPVSSPDPEKKKNSYDNYYEEREYHRYNHYSNEE